MMGKGWPCVLCFWMAAGASCSSDERTGTTAPDAGASPRTADAALPDHPIDRYGYAIVGEDVFPPLYERVEARCVPAAGAPTECATDDDCGPGFACVCGYPNGPYVGSQCVPAECRTSADCNGGRCLISIGGNPAECCSYGPKSLVCSRRGSTCQHGGDCEGNGIACIYDAALDYFECKPLQCTCG